MINITKIFFKTNYLLMESWDGVLFSIQNNRISDGWGSMVVLTKTYINDRWELNHLRPHKETKIRMRKSMQDEQHQRRRRWGRRWVWWCQWWYWMNNIGIFSFLMRNLFFIWYIFMCNFICRIFVELFYISNW